MDTLDDVILAVTLSGLNCTPTNHRALTRHHKQVIGIPAKRGAGFAVIRRGSKLPTRKGWNQAQNAIDAVQAKKHVDAGDNITLLAGMGNLYALDFDRDASRGYESIHLNGTPFVTTQRATAANQKRSQLQITLFGEVLR